MISGRGSKAFSVGADINWLEDLSQKEAKAASWLGKEICNIIEEGDKVVIAAGQWLCPWRGYGNCPLL